MTYTLQPLDCLTGTRECGLKLLEEASEACEAMKSTQKACQAGLTSYAMETRGGAIGELCDVLQVACNCLSALGVTAEELEGSMCGVDAHNEERGRRHMPEWGELKVEWVPGDE